MPDFLVLWLVGGASQLSAATSDLGRHDLKVADETSYGSRFEGSIQSHQHVLKHRPKSRPAPAAAQPCACLETTTSRDRQTDSHIHRLLIQIAFPIDPTKHATTTRGRGRFSAEPARLLSPGGATRLGHWSDWPPAAAMSSSGHGRSMRSQCC